MVFTGNPGTGKTTVARLMGRMFHALGILRKGHVVITDRSSLVANFVGQTATKTAAMIHEALDGVLFIDEAYDLARDKGHAHDFGGEAITKLLNDMEAYRDRLVVIVAGYPAKMQEFLESNEGLKSRFAYEVPFPDYRADELLEIFKRLAQEAGYHVSTAAEAQAKAYLQGRREQDGSRFGNARTVEQLFQRMEERLAERLVGGTEGELEHVTFEADDVPQLPADEWSPAPNGPQDRGTYGNYV
jgi:SpoVK/Ycf46/Vps4 family AAA+-type ATPase